MKRRALCAAQAGIGHCKGLQLGSGPCALFAALSAHTVQGGDKHRRGACGHPCGFCLWLRVFQHSCTQAMPEHANVQALFIVFVYYNSVYTQTIAPVQALLTVACMQQCLHARFTPARTGVRAGITLGSRRSSGMPGARGSRWRRTRLHLDQHGLGRCSLQKYLQR